MAMVFMEPAEREGIKTRLAMHILDNVVPRIMNDGIFIGDRIALAYTWYRFLCKHSASRCPDVPKNIAEWSLEDLRKIADALIEFAQQLIEGALQKKSL